MEARSYVKLKSGDMVRICSSVFFNTLGVDYFTGVALKTNGEAARDFRFMESAITRPLTISEITVMKLRGL